MSQAPAKPNPAPQRGSERTADLWRAIAVCGFLVLAVLLVFSRTLNQGFSNLDDFTFVYEEPHVVAGLSWSGIRWAFTTGPAGEWYPLAMLSHMLDCQLYGLNPFGHHLTNLLLHAASAVTLLLVLWRMTGELWPSGLAAALFALHPLHVESVAWISERRDVLSALFFMLTLGAYAEYVRHQSRARYLAVVGFFALGLMAKPMLVTLPPLLLLLDFWPLKRFGWKQPDKARHARPAPFPWPVVVDKLPLFALAIAAAGVTMLTHHPTPSSVTLPERLAGAAISCIAYVGQLFVPVGLSIFYSYPEAGWPARQVAAAVALLLAITVAAVIGRRTFPYFFVGWFWYIGMLVPVLGVTVVGMHARADRYTYLSQIGLYIALVWGVMQLGASWPARRWVFAASSALVLAALTACTWRQIGYWQDSVTLLQHAVACDPKSVTAHYNLARALSGSDERGAIEQYRQALVLRPGERDIYYVTRSKAENDLGDLAAKKGNLLDAIAHYRQALRWDPDSVTAHMNLAGLLAGGGNLDEAMIHFKRSMELAPDNPSIYCNLAVVLAQHGQFDEAITNCRKALAIDADFALAHSNLAAIFARQGDVDDAIVHFRRAILSSPDNPFSYHEIAQLLRQQGKMSEAARYDERGRKVNRRIADSHNRRGTELAQQGQLDPAIAEFLLAISIFPDDAQAHANLADALASQGKIDEAIVHFRRALEIDPNFAPAKQGLQQLSRR